MKAVPSAEEYIKPLDRRKVFRPSSTICPFDDCDKLFPKLPPQVKPKPIEVDTYFEELVDAETGEPIKLSNARWNAKEGRLNLDTKTILAMGTGQLNLKNLDSPNKLPPIQPHHQQHQPQVPSSSSDRRHPLVTQYLLEGPLNARFHKFWNVREDSIDLNDETRAEIMEEGVDYYDEANISSLDAFNLTMHMNSLISSNGSKASELSGDKDDSSTLGSSRVPSLQSSHFSSHYSHNNNNRHGNKFRRRRSASSGFSLHSRGSRGSRGTSVSNNSDKIQQYTDPKLAWSNKEAWLSLEEKLFCELFEMASQLEINKSLTQENKTKGGLNEVKKTCRQLARWRVKSLKDVVQAVDDEKKRDAERDKVLIENANKSEDTIHLLKKSQNEERKKGKAYLINLQQDMEIAFVTKLSEAGYLW